MLPNNKSQAKFLLDKIDHLRGILSARKAMQKHFDCYDWYNMEWRLEISLDVIQSSLNRDINSEYYFSPLTECVDRIQNEYSEIKQKVMDYSQTIEKEIPIKWYHRLFRYMLG